MRRNIPLLTSKVRNTLTDKCLTAIITEAFINGLPLDREEVAKEAAAFSEYSSNIISKMHPEALLNRAMESTANDSKANLFVKTLKSEISTVVEAATKRVVEEVRHKDTPTPEIAEQVKLDKEETEKLVEASKKSGTDAVSKLVKDKLIETLKEEKEAYDNSAKLREEVKQVLANSASDEETAEDPDASYESYLDMVLSPTDARSHISFFSKLQDVCMEALMYSTEEYNEVPFKTMEKITLESTFDYFDLSDRTLMDEVNAVKILSTTACESLDVSPEEKSKKMKKIAKTAFICSICIMTLLETLKTMHLAKPTVNDVRSFVENPTNIKDLASTTLGRVEDKVDAASYAVKKSVAMGAINNIELEKAKAGLESVLSVINEMPIVNSEESRKTRIISKLTTAIESINTTLPEEKIHDVDIFTTRKKEENFVALEHAIKVVGRKPMVDNIVLNVRSDISTSANGTADVEIRGMNPAGIPVTSYSISLNACEAFGSNIAEVIHDSAKYIDLGNKPVKMYFTDRGYSVPVKGE